jgi:radical SAM protein with 4Fe4S-binding SPASM domain
MLDLTDPLTLAHIRADQTLTPLSALVEITHACNVDCEHCYLDLVPDKKIGVLSLDEWKRILKELKDAGTLYLTISGGEILVRRDWFEIASHARRLGFALKLFTNGTLIDDDAADKMASLRLLQVEISLLGGIAATHDAIARRRGAFDKTIAGVKRLRARGVKVVLKCTAMEKNAEEIGVIETLAAELGCQFNVYFMVTPKNNGSTAPKELVATDDALLRAAKRVEELAGNRAPGSCGTLDARREEKRTETPCAAGRRTCHVGPTGNLFPCTQWVEPVGSLRETSFADLWSTSAELERIRSTRVGDFPVCTRCELLSICNPCMALALLERGLPDGPSPTRCGLSELRAKALGMPARSAWLQLSESDRASGTRAVGRVRLPLVKASA